MPTTVPPPRLGDLIRLLFTLIVGLYLAALACYLILRLLFGDRFWWLSLLNTFSYLLFLPLLILLPVALLFGMRRSALRLIPLAFVGGLWFAPYYLPKSLPAPDGQTLRVLTFNVWGRNRSMEAAMEWINNSRADVVLLQEVIPFYADRALPVLFERFPYRLSQNDGQRYDGAPNANITLSRYPIVEAHTLDLKTPGTANPLRIVLDVDGQLVTVINVHLAWPGSKPRLPLPRMIDNLYLRTILGFDDRARNSQIANLLAYLETEPHPYIVGGDFNTSDQSPTYEAMAAQMRDAFREAGSGFGGSWPVSSTRGLPSFLPPLIRIDYLWHSDHFRALEAQQGPPLGSDHLAVVATLALTPIN